MNAPQRRSEVRLIGGQWKRSKLPVADAPGLRPTPDRVRETLFNWLGQRLDGMSCLDLFAGSGALGFEALSRGASRVVMVERDRHVAAALRDSAQLLAASEVEIIEGDAIAYLKGQGEGFDLVFVDPPYASDLAGASISRLAAHLNAGARVYVESAAPLQLPPAWRELRADRAGAVRYALYELAP